MLLKSTIKHVRQYHKSKKLGCIALVKCDWCGKKQLRTISRINMFPHHFCSRKCYSKYRYWSVLVTKKCKLCGKSFSDTIGRINNSPNPQSFCSIQCANTWFARNCQFGKNNHMWNGGSSFKPYGIKFYMLRPEIFVRDRNICQLCGKRKYVKSHAVHHIDYNKKNNCKSNLITLCQSCNGKVNSDTIYWKRFFRRKMKRILRRCRRW